MNCKPGELAAVTRTTGAHADERPWVVACIGRVVKVATHDVRGVWSIEEPFTVELPDGRIGRIEGIGDQFLTPLRGLRLTTDALDRAREILEQA